MKLNLPACAFLSQLFVAASCYAACDTQKPIDVIFLMDNSYSSTYYSSYVQNGVSYFVETFMTPASPQTEVNRIGYTSTYNPEYYNFPLTNDTELFVDQFNYGYTGGSGSYYNGLLKAQSMFNFTEDHERVVIVYATGEEQSGTPGGTVAMQLKERGVKIFVLYSPDTYYNYQHSQTWLRQIASSPSQLYIYSGFVYYFGNHVEIFNQLLPVAVGQKGQVCRIYGAGNVWSFDGLKSRFQNTGSFKLISAPSAYFEVHGLFSPCYSEASVSCLTGIAIVEQSYNQFENAFMLYANPGELTLSAAYQDTYQSYTPMEVSDLINYFNNYGYASLNVLEPEGSIVVTYYTAFYSNVIQIKCSLQGLSLQVTSNGYTYRKANGVCGNIDTCSENDAMNSEMFRVENSHKYFETERFVLANVNLANVTTSKVKTEYVSASSQDCSALSPELQAQCQEDFDLTRSDGIAADFQHILFQECAAPCRGMLSTLAGISLNECSRYCSPVQIDSEINLQNLTNSNFSYNQPPFSADVQYSLNRTVIRMPEAVEGDYCLNVTAYDAFSREIHSTSYIRLACEGSAAAPLTLTAPNVSVQLSQSAGSTVMLRGQVSDPSRVRKMNWTLVEYPEDADSDPIVYANGYFPSITLYQTGQYVVSWVVYDGCNFFQKNVTINVNCPASWPRISAFISSFPSPYQSSSQYIDANVDFNGNAGYSYNWTFKYLDPPAGTVVESSDGYNYYLMFPEVKTLINQTSVYNASSVAPGAIVGPVSQSNYNGLTKQQVLGFTTTITNSSNVTSQPYQVTSYYAVTPALTLCRMRLYQTAQQQYQQFRFYESVPGGCVGAYEIKLNVSTACNFAVDTVRFDYTCGPKPFAMINHCGVGSTCNLNEVSSQSLPQNGAQVVLYFNYQTDLFQSFSLGSSETYDVWGRSLSRYWNVTTGFTTTNAPSAYFVGSQTSASISLKPIEAGDYTVSLNVTAASACASSVDTLKVRAVCNATCTAPLTFINGTNNALAGTTVYMTTGVSNVTCMHLKTYTYTVTQFPAIFYDGNYVSVLGLSTSGSSSGPISGNNFVSDASGFNWVPTWGGVYQASLVSTDGCMSSNVTAPITVTCPYGVSNLQISGPSTVSDVAGSFTQQNYTANAGVNGNPGSLQYRWYMYSSSGVQLATSAFQSFLATPPVAGSYNITLFASDGCSVQKTSVIITATCSPVPITPQLQLAGVNGQNINVTYTPNDNTTALYNKVFQVTNPSGVVSTPSVNALGTVFTVSMPGTYTVKLFFVNGCGSNSSSSLTYVAAQTYSITLNSAYSSAPIVAVMSSNRIFPQVNIDANTSVLTNIPYSSLQSSAYWYVKSAPALSVLKSYATITYTEFATTVDVNASTTIGQYNATSQLSQNVQRNLSQITTTSSLVISKLSSFCDGANPVTSALFGACFRPDVAGTYVLGLRVFGSYGETYELASPITVVAQCASNQVISQLAVQAQSAMVLYAPQRLTFNADQIFSDSSNLQEFGWVVYGTQNYVEDSWNATTNMTDYLVTSVQQSLSHNNLFFVNNRSKTVSFVARYNYSNWLLELTTNTGCQYQGMNMSVPISIAESGIGVSSMKAYGGARFIGNDTMPNGQIGAAFAFNPDKRVGLSLQVQIGGAIPFEIDEVSFGRCYHPEGSTLASTPTFSSGALSAGAIAGIVIGVLAGVGLLAAGGYFMYRRMNGGGGSKA